MQRLGVYVGILASSVMLASCNGKTSDSQEVEDPVKVEARDLIIEAPDSVEAAGTKVTRKPETTENSEFAEPEQSVFGETMPVLATGTEPYWTAEIGGGWVSFERPGLPLVEVPLPEFDRTRSPVSLTSEGLTLTLSETCEDETGGLSVKISYQDVDYFGCAVSANGARTRGATEASWKDLIVPSLTAIDACLDQAGEPRLVLALYPREPGTVGMILGDELGGYEECGADTETGEVYFRDPMSADQARDWMSGEAFARNGKSPGCRAGEALESDLGAFSASGC